MTHQILCVPHFQFRNLFLICLYFFDALPCNVMWSSLFSLRFEVGLCVSSGLLLSEFIKIHLHRLEKIIIDPFIGLF